MIRIDHTNFVDESEIEFDFIRSSGPGGQNINKVSSAVKLSFNIDKNLTLPKEAKDRLKRLAGSRLSGNGVIIIDAKRFRSQFKNREDALQRLIILIRKALEEPRFRKKTKPSISSKAARISEKKRRGEIKRTRRNIRGDLD
jgi:ribosome-associated protein